MPPDLKDPRVLGEGPCGLVHHCHVHCSLRSGQGYLEYQSVDGVQEDIGSNQYASWINCAKCALRLGTWRRRRANEGASGHSARSATLARRAPAPGLVRAALDNLRQRDTWPNHIRSKDVKDEIEAVASSLRAPARRFGSRCAAPSGAQTYAGSAAPTGGPAPRCRAASLSPVRGAVSNDQSACEVVVHHGGLRVEVRVRRAQSADR